MPNRSLHFPIFSAGAEYLVMGYLMRRNILTYKAPPGNEGYDLICIHPDPRHRPANGEPAQVRVQVKSRYGVGERGFPVKLASISAFDFLIAVFLNIGDFRSGRDGLTGAKPPDFYTFTSEFIRAHHGVSGGWEKVMLTGSIDNLSPYKDEAGFEFIAKALGISHPSRDLSSQTSDDEEEL